MVVDTSALIAVLRAEPEALDFTRVIIASQPPAVIAVPTLFEASIVLERVGGAPVVNALDRFLDVTQLRAVPFSIEHLSIARDAYRRYGKGSGHAARLNFGDCFAYAIAKARQEPLLFKGDDFSHTDIAPAIS